MTIENKGPGGVGNSYGQRVTATPKKMYSSPTGQNSPLRKGKAVQWLQYLGQANFTLSGTGATKEDSFSPLISTQGIKITNPTASGTANLDYIPATPMDISDKDDFLIAFHTPDPSKFNGFNIYLSSDAAGFSNSYRVPLVTTGGFGDRGLGWNVFGWRKSEMIVSGNPDPKNIKQVRTQLSTNPGGMEVTLDSIWANAKTRAKCMIIFDDGWFEAYDYNGGHGMYTAMKARGLRGSASIIGSRVAQNFTVSYAQLRDMHDNGFDLTVHGPGYAGANLNNLLSYSTEDEALVDVKANRDFLLSQGYSRGADFYVFPQGAYTETLMQKMRTTGGIEMARGTAEALCYPYFPARDYLMKLPSVDHGGKTFAQMKPWIDRAIATGATLIIYGHRIQTAGGATGLFVNQYEFEQTLDYLVANNQLIDVVTPSEWKKQVLSGV